MRDGWDGGRIYTWLNGKKEKRKEMNDVGEGGKMV